MEKSPSPHRCHNTSTSATASSMAARPRGHRGRCGGILGCNDEKYIHYMWWYDIILLYMCYTLYVYFIILYYVMLCYIILYYVMLCCVILYYTYIYRIDIKSVCVCACVCRSQKLPCENSRSREPWLVFAPDSTGRWSVVKCEPLEKGLAQKRRFQLHGLWSSPVIIYIEREILRYIYIYILYKYKGSIIPN